MTLKTTIDQLVTDATLLNSFIHGADDETIETDGGTIDCLAKIVAAAQAAVTAALAGTVAALTVIGAITAGSVSSVSGYLAIGATVASSGAVRLANNTSIGWRNAANTGNNLITCTSGDAFVLYPNGLPALTVSSPASAVDYFSISSAATGNRVAIGATGSTANVGVSLYSRGTSSIAFRSNGNTATQFEIVGSNTSAVNYLTVTGVNTASNPYLSAVGTDTNVGMSLVTKGVGNVTLYSNNFGSVLGVFTAVASSVNYLGFSPAATGNAVSISALGSDTNVNLIATAKGSGVIAFYNNNFSQTLLQIQTVASAVNYFQIYPNSTGAGPALVVAGSDTNISMGFTRKGTGNFIFTAADANACGFEIGNSVTGNRNCFIDFHSDTTNTDYSTRILRNSGVNGTFELKNVGTGNIRLITGDSIVGFAITYVASGVNYLYASPAATGNPAVLGAVGTDANIDLSLAPQGTGVVRFGTHSAIGAEVITGFISMKDAGGTVRKVAIVS